MVDAGDIVKGAKFVAGLIDPGIFKTEVLADQLFQFFIDSGATVIKPDPVKGKLSATGNQSRSETYEMAEKTIVATVSFNRKQASVGIGPLSVPVYTKNDCKVSLLMYPKGANPGFFAKLFGSGAEKKLSYTVNLDQYINNDQKIISQPQLNALFGGFLNDLGIQPVTGRKKTAPQTAAANPKAVAYIQQNQGQYSKPDLNQSLKSAGYTDAEINAAWKEVGG